MQVQPGAVEHTSDDGWPLEIEEVEPVLSHVADITATFGDPRHHGGAQLAFIKTTGQPQPRIYAGVGGFVPEADLQGGFTAARIRFERGAENPSQLSSEKASAYGASGKGEVVGGEFVAEGVTQPLKGGGKKLENIATGEGGCASRGDIRVGPHTLINS